MQDFSIPSSFSAMSWDIQCLIIEQAIPHEAFNVCNYCPGLLVNLMRMPMMASRDLCSAYAGYISQTKLIHKALGMLDGMRANLKYFKQFHHSATSSYVFRWDRRLPTGFDDDYFQAIIAEDRRQLQTLALLVGDVLAANNGQDWCRIFHILRHHFGTPLTDKRTTTNYKIVYKENFATFTQQLRKSDSGERCDYLRTVPAWAWQNLAFEWFHWHSPFGTFDFRFDLHNPAVDEHARRCAILQSHKVIEGMGIRITGLTFGTRELEPNDKLDFDDELEQQVDETWHIAERGNALRLRFIRVFVTKNDRDASMPFHKVLDGPYAHLPLSLIWPPRAQPIRRCTRIIHPFDGLF